MTHQHDHDHGHGSELGEMPLRVRTLETLLARKGYIDQTALDAIVQAYETHVGPRVGAQVVARAWVDRDFRERLLADGGDAIESEGLAEGVGDHLVVVKNTPSTHHLVVCTLCSCYPWTLLGLPPSWYKSSAYRSRAVREPRAVLREFGVDLPDEIEIRVWDSTAETRYLVLPMQPAGTEGWTEEQLADLVPRDALIGTAVARAPQSGAS